MNPTDRDLLIEIRVYTSDKEFEVSTGYPVARDLILTARHGLFPVGWSADAPIRLRWHHQSGDTREFTELPRSAVCWESESLDAALIHHDFPQGLVDWRHLSPVRPFHDERWSSEGFPLGGDASYGGVTAFPVAGRVHGAATKVHRFHLGLDDGFKRPPHWGGISGAPVFVRGQVVGVIVSTPTAAESRLKATPSAALFEAKGFRDAIGYDRESGRSAALRASVKACLEQSQQARFCLGRALGSADTEAQALANGILELPTPQSVIDRIKDAHDRALVEHEVGAAATLRELALTVLPARLDSVVVESIRGSMADPERPVLTPPICTETGAELAMAAADEQPARFKPAGPGYDYPDGELNLDHPPRCGIADQDEYFKEAWEKHLINKFADNPRLRRFEHAARARIAIRRLQETSEEKKRTHYVLVYDEGHDADNQTWERRARLVRKDCPSLVFLRLSDDNERIVTETALLDPFCKLFVDAPETGQ